MKFRVDDWVLWDGEPWQVRLVYPDFISIKRPGAIRSMPVETLRAAQVPWSNTGDGWKKLTCASP